MSKNYSNEYMEILCDLRYTVGDIDLGAAHLFTVLSAMNKSNYCTVLFL